MGEKTCTFCGQPLPKQIGRGRKREYHDNCRQLLHILGWAEDLIMEIDFTKEASKEKRSHLWYLANLLNKRYTS